MEDLQSQATSSNVRIATRSSGLESTMAFLVRLSTNTNVVVLSVVLSILSELLLLTRLVMENLPSHPIPSSLVK